MDWNSNRALLASVLAVACATSCMDGDGHGGVSEYGAPGPGAAAPTPSATGSGGGGPGGIPASGVAGSSVGAASGGVSTSGAGPVAGASSAGAGVDAGGAPSTPDGGDASSGADANAGPVDACGARGVSILAKLHSIGNGRVAADSSYVYYDDPGCSPLGQRGCVPVAGPIYRVPRCGGTPEVLAPNQQLLAGLVDGGSVLYALGTTLERIHKDTGARDHFPALPAAPYPTTSPTPFAASTHDFVYFDYSSHRIVTLAVDATSARPLGGTSADPVALAVTEHAVFWTDGSALFRAPLDGSWSPVRLSEVDPTAVAGSTVFAAGEGAFAAVGGSVFSLPATGATVTTQPFASPPKLWSDDYLYSDEDSWNPSTERARFGANPETQKVLRIGHVGVVREGMMYWSAEGYVLRRAAAAESAADPYDAAGEKPDLQVPFTAEIVQSLLALPGGGFAARNLGLDPEGDAYGVPLLRFYSESGAPRSLPIPADRVASIGGDRTGNFVTLEHGTSGSVWVQYDATGHELGRGPYSFDDGGLAVGPSGRFALFTTGAATAPTLEIHDAGGALVKSLPTGGVQVASAAVGSTDRVFVGASVRIGETFFGKAAAAAGGSVVAFAADGSVAWTLSTTDLTVDMVAAAPAGGVVFMGTSYGMYKAGRDGTVAVPGRLNSVIVQVDPDGAVLSLRSFEGQGFRLAVDGEGNAVVAGSASDRYFIDLMDPRVRGARTEVSFAARFDPAGGLVSVNRVESPSLSALATGADGAVFVAFGQNVARFDRR